MEFVAPPTDTAEPEATAPDWYVIKTSLHRCPFSKGLMERQWDLRKDSLKKASPSPASFRSNLG